MIPVSLTIKGLYSYQKEQTVDFTKLLEGQLFGIFGSVGSGKSTILEAISYALYGDTERLNKTNDNRNYNMMNLKSNELLIDFIFVNYDEQLYRFIVRGKRNSKQFDKVGTLERSAYKKVNSQWEPLESVSGEKIIGLSYDNFRRTIIIPQGRFQEFLQLGDSERTRMLKEIFQLEKYEFFYQTSSLEKKNNEEIQHLTGELAVFADVNADSMSQSKEKLNVLSVELAKYKADLLLKEQRLKEQESVKQLHTAFRKNELELEVLNNQKSHFEEIRKQVSDFNYCVLHFRENLNQEASFVAEIQKHRLQKEQLAMQFVQVETGLQQAEKELRYYQSEAEKLESYKSQLSDYDIAIKTISFKKDIATNTQRIKNGELELEKVLQERNLVKAQMQDASNQIKLLKSQMPDFNELMAVRNWFATLKNEQTNMAREEDNLRRIQLKVSNLNNEIKSLLNSDLFSNKALKIEEAKIYLQKQKQACKKQLEDLQYSLTHYEVQLKLGEFASVLHGGSACPLCGSLEHPEILQLEDVNTHIAEAKIQMLLLKQRDTDLDKILSDAESLIFQQKQLKEQCAEAEEKVKQANTKVSDHYSVFQWADFDKDNELLLEQKFNQADTLKKNLEEAENNLELLQSKYQECEDKYQRFKTGIDKIQRELDVKEAEISLLRNQFKGQNYKEQSNRASEELTQEKDELQQYINKIQTEFSRFSELVNLNRQQYEVLKAKIESANTHLVDLDARLKDISEQLTQKLATTSFLNIEEVKNILQQDNVNSLETELKEYDLRLYNLQQKHIELKEELKGKVFDEAAFEELSKQFGNLKEQFQAKNDEFVKEQHFLKQQEINYQRKLTIEQQIAKLQLRKDNIFVLKNMFKGSGFVSYISGVYLSQLCAAANDRFYKLTHQQLRLEVTDKNDFQVRDYLNDGKLRSVKTLSGGQTFQASLSLALALAESVQQQNKSKQNFFFLDEGFGSLDKESLQVAFSTLKSLRKENRIVGVISHVEELQQEIDVFLKVKNDAAEGSTVQGNWE